VTTNKNHKPHSTNKTSQSQEKDQRQKNKSTDHVGLASCAKLSQAVEHKNHIHNANQPH
jgi:hypothetical protein